LLDGLAEGVKKRRRARRWTAAGFRH